LSDLETLERCSALGIFTGLNIPNHTLSFLQQHFGKSGALHSSIFRSIDNVPSGPIDPKVGRAENTFLYDLTDFDAVIAELRPLIGRVWRHCERTGDRRRRWAIEHRVGQKG
jgi:DNA polymerase-4